MRPYLDVVYHANTVDVIPNLMSVNVSLIGQVPNAILTWAPVIIVRQLGVRVKKDLILVSVSLTILALSALLGNATVVATGHARLLME